MKQKYKFGIFDVDGTLIDSMSAYKKAFSGILNRKFGISKEEADKYYLNSAGTPLDVQFIYMLQKNNKYFETKEVQSMMKEFFDIVDQVDYQFYDGAINLVKELVRKKFTLFVTTGSQTSATKNKLGKADIINCFELILGSSEIPKGPEHIEEFAKSVNLSAEEFSSQAFYCGDGARDMEIAKMFGIYAIGVAQTLSKEKLSEAGADVVVDKIGNVLELDVLE